MKLWLSLVLVLALFAPSAAEKQNLLLRWTSRGGLTPKGVGFSEIRVDKKGAFRIYSLARDERVGMGGKRGDPNGANGWTTLQLSPQELERLRTALQACDFQAVRLDAAKTPPSASDGADQTLIVGPHEIPLWQVTNLEVLPVVPVLNELRQRASQGFRK